MKYTHLFLIAITITLTGCTSTTKKTTQEVTNPTPQGIAVGEPNGPLTAKDFINIAFDSGNKLIPTNDINIDKLPYSIQKTQYTGDGYRLGEIEFIFIYFPNLNYDIQLDNRKNQWNGGILMRKNSNSPWETFISIRAIVPTTPTGMNPIGMFNDNGLTIDIADHHGAKSGEGNVTRFKIYDGGKFWQQTGCFYMTPETYYKNKNNILDGINTKLPKSTNCTG